ncbi:heat shock 70 kDa protein cognate 4-like [Papaver somniferum]|uniref:heat shock 70 kDa protein cognate 4-like n=1 Tax=Papaver somniferum TaxID=3469 RepID=UPI000E704102|nr:heat shock 70 kDa protein cognate 4-like [Papaver somniferum]
MIGDAANDQAAVNPTTLSFYSKSITRAGIHSFQPTKFHPWFSLRCEKLLEFILVQVLGTWLLVSLLTLLPRQATGDAGTIAGLNAITLSINKGNFEVKATAGDTHIGGEDLITGCLITLPKSSKGSIRTSCENAKRNLSSTTLANVEVDALHDGIDFPASITCAKSEHLNLDLLVSVWILRMGKTTFHDAILVRGSTRIPKVQSISGASFGVSQTKVPRWLR